jgi:LysR family transcriptional activator of mexEF-oprN operon
VEPSKKAIELVPIINQILQQISHQVLLSSQFKAKSFTGTLNIGLTNYAESLLHLIFDALSTQAENC